MADYSGLDKMLHKMALGSPALAEMVHDIERGMYLKSAPPSVGGAHVYVTGLARAGSTILMREIHGSGAFGSLTYADMPFVLAPNLWAKLARPKPAGPKAERAHGDGIQVDTHSPEALEEVYWRIFCGAQYITATGLKPHNPDADEIAAYLDFVRLILRRTGKTRYLAKNNNAILRLQPLAQALPQSLFLIPVRDPLQHAQSLLHQHQRFLSPDPFTAQYMVWLGHHEFGQTHRPFLFGPTPANTPAQGPAGDPMGLDYWLRLWLSVHQSLGPTAAALPNALMVPHDDLCANPALWPALSARMGLPARPLAEVRASAARAIPPHDVALAAQADALYQSLRANALQRILG